MAARAARVVMLVAALALLAAARPSDWHSALHRDHPLAGTIWDVAAGRAIGADTLVTRLAARRFVLLGEKHDNPDHHRLQAWTLAALVAAGRRPAVAFEMLRADQAEALAKFLATSPPDAAGLGAAVDWSRSGWPAWSMYAPIADVAVRARLPMVAANLSESVTAALRRGGVPALEPALATRLALDRPLSDDVRQRLLAEIRDGHCGRLPERALESFVTVQRARDAHMALAMREGGGDGAVLIAGATHARRDIGVPRALPDGDVASVAFAEVTAGVTSPPAGVPFDYVWLTPRVDDRDPCEKFRPALDRFRQP